MPYDIVFRTRAQKEYNQAVAWYNERSIQAAENFVSQVRATISAIKLQPDFYRKTYKKFREANPCNIIHFVEKRKQQIVITSIFHQKRDPSNKFTR